MLMSMMLKATGKIFVLSETSAIPGSRLISETTSLVLTGIKKYGFKKRRFKLVSEGNKQEHRIHGWLDIIRRICSIQCTLPVSTISRSHPGNRPWNYMYTQACRHQQVILIPCKRVISRVCLPADSTLYSAKNIRDSIWKFYVWIQGVCPVLKHCTGSKHKVFLLKLTWLHIHRHEAVRRSPLLCFYFLYHTPFHIKIATLWFFSLSV